MQTSFSTDSVATLHNYTQRFRTNPRRPFQSPDDKRTSTSSVTDKASTLRAEFKSFFTGQLFTASSSKDTIPSIPSRSSAITSSTTSTSDTNNCEDDEEEDASKMQDVVYNAAIDSIKDLQTNSVLKHLLKEKQRAVEEKQCLSNYINYFHELIPTPLHSSITRGSRYAMPELELDNNTKSEVFAVGLNEDFQLGLGRKVNYQPFTSKFRKADLNDKIDLAAAERIQIVHLACSSLHTLAIDQDGRLYSWGLAELLGRVRYPDSPLPVTLPTRIKSIAAGEYISICLDMQGSVFTFGGFRNSKGKVLGYHKFPRRMSFKSAIHQIAASESMAAALDEAGNLFTWGNCEFGEGGRPPFCSTTPCRVFTSNPISQIWAFGFSLFFTTSANDTYVNDLYACGKNGFGEFGLGHSYPTYHPVPISSMKDVKHIAGGIHHTLILTFDGRVFGAGKNVDGQLGFGMEVDFSLDFLEIAFPDSFSYPANHIAAGSSSHQSYVIDSKNNLYTSGQNEYGQLGNEDQGCIFQFTLVNLKNRRCVKVAGGSNFSVLLLTERQS